jgi:hypothetical protein
MVREVSRLLVAEIRLRGAQVGAVGLSLEPHVGNGDEIVRYVVASSLAEQFWTARSHSS